MDGAEATTGPEAARRATERAAGRASVLLAVLLLLPGPAAARPAAGPGAGAGIGDTTACELRLAPTPVRVREAAVLVTVRASTDPGPLRGVRVEARSGVVVLKAAPARDREGVVARMALDTSDARTGRWPVVLRGGAAECTGTLVVEAGGGG